MKQHLVNILLLCLCLCSVASGRVLYAAREATVSGRCLAQTDAASMDLPDGTNSTEKATADTALKALRSSYIKYNQKKRYVIYIDDVFACNLFSKMFIDTSWLINFFIVSLQYVP